MELKAGRKEPSQVFWEAQLVCCEPAISIIIIFFDNAIMESIFAETLPKLYIMAKNDVKKKN